MLRSIFTLGAAAAGLLALTGPAVSAPVEWKVADGGNGHFYELLAHSSFGWDDARSLALSLGGYLATVTSIEEMAFLDGVNDLNVIAFLGGSDEAVEGTWRWMDGPEAGAAFTYTNWNPGEPNNLGNEDYLMAYGYNTWNDVPLGFGASFSLVEYDSLSADVPLPAAAPLLLAGLGLIAAAGRRRR